MANPKPVTTNKLSIVDNNGKERIIFEVSDEGEGNPVIRMRDRAGKERITLFLDEEDGDSDARVELRDSNGVMRIELLVTGEGFYQLGVEDRNGVHHNFLQES